MNERKVNRRKYVAVAGVAVATAVIGGAAYYLSRPGPPTPTATPTPTPTATPTPTPSGKYGGTVVIAAESPSTGLDPATLQSTSDVAVTIQVCEQLVRFDQDLGKIVPHLAESWEASPDSKVFTFHLRKGVRWQNLGKGFSAEGREFTAEDVKFTFDRVMEKGLAKAFFPYLEKVEVVDKYTVRFINSEPYAPFITNLYSSVRSIIVPKLTEDEMKVIGDFNNFLIGTGPFILAERKLEAYTKMTKNPDYWMKDEEGGELPYLDAVINKPIPDPSARLISLETGESDLMMNLLAKDYQRVVDNPELEVYRLPDLYYHTLTFNCTKDPFSKVQFRQACHLAMNKHEINDIVFEGRGHVAYSMLPEWNPYYYKVTGWEQDVSRAKSLLEEIGIPEGFTFNCYTYDVDPNAEKVMVVLKSQFEKVGLNMEIKILELSTYIAEVMREIGPESIWDTTVPGNTHKHDPWTSIAPYLRTGSGYTDCKYSNSEFDKLLDDLAQTSDFEKRKEIAKQVQIMEMSEAPKIPLVFWPMFGAYNKRVKGNPKIMVQGWTWPARKLWTTKK